MNILPLNITILVKFSLFRINMTWKEPFLPKLLARFVSIIVICSASFFRAVMHKNDHLKRRILIHYHNKTQIVPASFFSRTSSLISFVFNSNIASKSPRLSWTAIFSSSILYWERKLQITSLLHIISPSESTLVMFLLEYWPLCWICNWTITFATGNTHIKLVCFVKLYVCITLKRHVFLKQPLT